MTGRRRTGWPIGRISLMATLTAVVLVATPASAQQQSPPVTETISVWQPGGIDGPFIEAAITSAAGVGAEWVVAHRGTIPLVSVTRAGRVVQEAPEGYRYPMSALALDPRRAAPLIGRSAAAVLQAGEVLMGATSADLRGATTGDVVRFIGWDGSTVELRIGAVVADDVIGWAELVFSSAVAESFGFVRPSSVIVWDVEHTDELVIDLWRRLPEGVTRISFSTEPDRLDDVLPTALVKQQFGEFAYRVTGSGDQIQVDPEWRAENIVTVDLPLLGVFRCHRLIAPLIESAMDEVVAAGLAGEISYSDFQVAGGCWNARLIRGGDKGGAVSRHSWGIAVDINPSANPYGGAVDMHPEIVEIFRELGFAWGGGWTYTDGGHFEFNAES